MNRVVKKLLELNYFDISIVFIKLKIRIATTEIIFIINPYMNVVGFISKTKFVINKPANRIFNDQFINYVLEGLDIASIVGEKKF